MRKHHFNLYMAGVCTYGLAYAIRDHQTFFIVANIIVIAINLFIYFSGEYFKYHE